MLKVCCEFLGHLMAELYIHSVVKFEMHASVWYHVHDCLLLTGTPKGTLKPEAFALSCLHPSPSSKLCVKRPSGYTQAVGLWNHVLIMIRNPHCLTLLAPKEMLQGGFGDFYFYSYKQTDGFDDKGVAAMTICEGCLGFQTTLTSLSLSPRGIHTWHGRESP